MWPPLTSNPQSVDWYAAALNEVRRYCGWHVAPVIEEELVLDGSGGRALLLPSNQVLELVSLTEDGTELEVAQVGVSVTGVLRKRDKSRWTNELGGVRATIRHGYEHAPDVEAVVNLLAERGQATGAGHVQEQAGPFGRRRATTTGGAIASVPLLQPERDMLAPYVLSWGV